MLIFLVVVGDDEDAVAVVQVGDAIDCLVMLVERKLIVEVVVIWRQQKKGSGGKQNRWGWS